MQILKLMNTSVLSFLEKYWDLTIGYFINPDKRIFIPYLIVTIIWALIVFFLTKRKGSFLKYIFNKKVWLGKSAQIDYLFFFFNAFIKIFLIIPYLSYGLELAFWVHEKLLTFFGYCDNPLSYSLSVVLYTISLTIFIDFAVYLLHYAMHKSPILWEFHKVHHSARVMNPFTQYRLHPIELLLNNFVSMFISGCVTGIFIYWRGGAIDLWLILGVNIFSFFFYVFGANLRHSHILLKYPRFLEFIFLSPVQHQVHHSLSPAHWNKNMGSRLAIWDWMFGTLYLSKNISHLSFGLGASLDKKYTTFRANLFLPFQNVGKKIYRHIKR